MMNLGTERSETMTKRQKGEMKLIKRMKARTTRENREELSFVDRRGKLRGAALELI